MNALTLLGRYWAAFLIALVLLIMLLSRVVTGAYVPGLTVPLIVTGIIATIVVGQVIVHYTKLKFVGWIITGLGFTLGIIYLIYALHPMIASFMTTFGGSVEEAGESAGESAGNVWGEIYSFFHSLLQSDASKLALLVLVAGGLLLLVSKMWGGILLILGLLFLLALFFFPGIRAGVDRDIACLTTPGDRVCQRSTANALPDGRWEEIIPGKTYAVRDNEWLIFTRPARKCVSVRPPEGLEVKFPGNEVWIRSHSGTRYIKPRILHIGEVDADGDVCT